MWQVWFSHLKNRFSTLTYFNSRYIKIDPCAADKCYIHITRFTQSGNYTYVTHIPEWLICEELLFKGVLSHNLSFNGMNFSHKSCFNFVSFYIILHFQRQISIKSGKCTQVWFLIHKIQLIKNSLKHSWPLTDVSARHKCSF